MSADRARPPQFAVRLLACVLPQTSAGRSVLGDLLDEYQRRPVGIRRRLWFWWAALDIGLRYLPDRLRGRHRASMADAATRRGPGLSRFLAELGHDAIHAGRLARRYRAPVARRS